MRARNLTTVSKKNDIDSATIVNLVGRIVLEKKNCDTIWCNARLVAIDFYKSLGFKEIGPKFNISEIGPHYKMYKSVINQ